jgi:hypothetical protein
MKKILLLFGMLCALELGAAAQGFRFDQRVVTVATNVPSGASAPVYAMPNMKVTICPSSACAAKTTIFIDQAMTVQASNPLTTDSQGSFGFWAPTGTYFYKVETASGNLVGTYPFSMGGSGGGGSGSVTSVAGGSPLFSVANPTTSATLVQLAADPHTVLGNNTGVSASPSFFPLQYSEIGGTMPLFGASVSGAVPASGGDPTRYLNAAGSWTTPGSSGGATFPGTPGIVFNTSPTASRPSAFADVVALWAGGACSGLLKGDGTCPASSGGLTGLTNGYIPQAISSTDIGNSFINYGITNAGAYTSTKDIYAPSFHGTGSGPAGFTGPENTAISGSAGVDALWADSTAHSFMMNNNNTGAVKVAGTIASGSTALGTSVIASGAAPRCYGCGDGRGID